MRNNPTLGAVLVTVAVIVPAGWHALHADIQTDGKRLRPLQQSLLIGDVKVTLDVDRTVIMTGDTVTATLVAYSDTPKQVTVDLRALHSSNYEGARVETPWIPIDRETLKLTAAPDGGKPVKTMIKLGERPNEPALTDSFRIHVAAHGDKPSKLDGEDGYDYDTAIGEGRAAAIYIRGWSGDNLKLSISPEGPLRNDAPFTIAVRVKNTSGATLARHPYVNLGTEAALEGTEGGDHEDAAVTIEELRDDGVEDDAYYEAHNLEFKRGQETITRYRVTPKKTGLRKITFLASAFESDEEPGPTTAGALDARTFTLTDGSPTVAARQPRAKR